MIVALINSLFCLLIILKLVLYLTNVRCKSKVCLIGKTALITGGNSGLGSELAKELASRGCTVIIADKHDASSTVSQLIKETHNPKISSRIVDFGSLKSVRLFAEKLKNEVEELHILVNNAGTLDMTFKKTEDDIHEIMQVNYFSHFLLTHLLLDLLLKSKPSRIIYTSSLAAYIGNLTENNLKGEKLKGMFELGPYANSKLAGAIMSKILSKKLSGSGVTSNTLHPGIVKTKIWNAGRRTMLTLNLWLMWTYFFGKNCQEGVQTLTHLACSNEVKDISGEFFMECISVWQPWPIYNTQVCEKLWELSEKYVKLKPEEKIETLLQHWENKN